MIEEDGKNANEQQRAALFDAALAAPIEMDDVKVDISEIDSKLDISMNSVIRVEDDAQSSLDTSIISVIKVSEADAGEQSELGSARPLEE